MTQSTVGEYIASADEPHSAGGSAALRPTRAVSPLDGIKEALGESVEIEYTVGAYGPSCKSCPLLLLFADL